MSSNFTQVTKITENAKRINWHRFGYLPDEHLLARCGVELGAETKVPVFDHETFETNVPGLYLCGTVMAGVFTEKIFIENGRDHAAAIADHLSGREVRKVKELIERI